MLVRWMQDRHNRRFDVPFLLDYDDGQAPQYAFHLLRYLNENAPTRRFWSQKMQIFSSLERLMIKLSALPGLGFLASYVSDFHGRTGQIQSRVNRYKGYVSTVREVGGDVGQAAGRSKKNQEVEDEEYQEEYEEDDDESYLQ